MNFSLCIFMKDSWGEKELTGFVTLDGLTLNKVYKVGGTFKFKIFVK